MRQTRAEDLYDLHNLYQEAVSHANYVGKIDWPDPIPLSFVSNLMATDEFYCFETEQIDAAVKLSFSSDQLIWGDDSTRALYLAKIATSHRVRNQGYFKNVMLPDIISFAGFDLPLRLDCLADNDRLKMFYVSLGFVSLGDVEFYSKKQSRNLTVTRFETVF